MGIRNGEYVISRQLSWPDGIYYVELETGGEDCPSPGMVGDGKSYGEGTFTDPREAAANLIAVRNAWQKDFALLADLEDDEDPQTTLLVSIGTTAGGMFSHDPQDMTDEAIIAWGEKTYENMPKCDQCGELRRETWTPTDDPDLGKFCSENCCDKAVAYDYELNRSYVIESPEDWTWYNADDGSWVEDPEDATHYNRDDIEHPAIGLVVTLDDAKESFERENFGDIADPREHCF